MRIANQTSESCDLKLACEKAAHRTPWACTNKTRRALTSHSCKALRTHERHGATKARKEGRKQKGIGPQAIYPETKIEDEISHPNKLPKIALNSAEGRNQSCYDLSLARHQQKGSSGNTLPNEYQKTALRLRRIAIPIVVGKWHVQVVGETVLAAQFHTSAKHWKDGGRLAPHGWC